MAKELEKVNGVKTSFQDQMAQAELFIKSGFFPKEIDTPQKAWVVMKTGMEMGLSPTKALRHIVVIHGKPCLSAALLLDLVQRHPQFEYSYPEEETDAKCVFVIKRKGCPQEYKSVFTIEDARKLGMLERHNWKVQPKTMLRWRAISQACRIMFSDAIGGVYIVEEMTDVELAPAEPGKEPEVIECGPEPALEDEIPCPVSDDLLGAFVLPAGAYKGLTLLQITGQITDGGRSKGLEYLEKIAEATVKNAEQKERQVVVKRFLEVFFESR